MTLEPIGREAPATYRPYFCAVVLVVVGALVYLGGHVKAVAQLEELEALRLERQAVLRQQDKLKAKVAGLKQSSRIRRIAAAELGMVFPTEPPRNLYLTPARPTGGNAH